MAETWAGEIIGADARKGERPLRRRAVPAGSDKPNPGMPSATHKAMASMWEKVEAVLGGTESMRSKSDKYLPRHPMEKDQQYEERLARSVLTNVAEMTLNSWTGRPFANPIKVEEDVPKPIVELLDDVDLKGNALGVFCRNWFRKGLAKALCHVIVDYPYSVPSDRRSLADDAAAGARPYLCLVYPEDLLFASATIVGGREVLTHVRIRETSVEKNGWGEEVVKRIRVFDHDPRTSVTTFSLWRFEQRPERWELEAAPQVIDIDEIPLVTFYGSERDGLMFAKSPLEDLVDLNIAHWQSDSDQMNCLTVSRFPMLAVSGIAPEDLEQNPVVMSPRKVLSAPSESGKWYFVEQTGSALAAGEKSIDKLEARMAQYGSEFLKRRPGSETATARVLESVQSTSPLEDATVRFNDALAQVIALLGKWMKIEETGTVSIETNLAPLAADASDYGALTTARQTRDISRKTYLAELKRRGTLDENFDADEDQEELDNESLEGQSDIQVDPAQKEPDETMPPVQKKNPVR